MEGICDWKHCRTPSVMGYKPREDLEKVEVCDKHWNVIAEAETRSERVACWRKLSRWLEWTMSLDIDTSKGTEMATTTRSSKGTKKSGSKKSNGKKNPKKDMAKKDCVSYKAPVAEKNPNGRPGENWAELFETNAKCSKLKRMTDEQIQAEMRKRFPDKATDNFTEVRRVQTHRNAFNQGYFHGGEVPKLPSVKYDSNGDPIVGRVKSESAPKAEKKESKKSAGKKADAATTPSKKKTRKWRKAKV